MTRIYSKLQKNPVQLKSNNNDIEENEHKGMSFPAVVFGNQTIQMDKADDEKKSEIAGTINSSGNIIGGLKDVLEGSDSFIKIKKMEEAKKAAEIKKAAAIKAQKAAGSGKSVAKNLKASKATKSASEATKDFSKATKAADNIGGAKKFISPVAKFLDKLPLDGIGFFASLASKYYSSDNTTTTGKVVDAGSTAALDTAFSAKFPLAAAIDAVLGFIPGGDRINISNTMSNSVSSITGVGESILTGEISGINNFHQKSLNGENTWLFEKAAEFGESYKNRDGVAERVERTGDFWGGTDTTSGRAGAFAASIPILGEIGEGLGKGAGWAALKGEELWEDTFDVADDISDYLGDNFTLDPSEIEWDPTEWF